MRCASATLPSRARLAGDVFEMRRLAADHASQCHDRVEALTRGGGFRKHGQFEGARRPRDFHVRVRDTGTAAAPRARRRAVSCDILVNRLTTIATRRWRLDVRAAGGALWGTISG